MASPALHRTIAAVVALFCSFPAASGADDVAAIVHGTYWGEAGSALFQRFRGRAAVLLRPIDFGDSYAQIVLRDVAVGGVPVIAFFQMDKATGGLKRLQFERQRHGVNPPAFRAIVSGIEADYGAPDAMCEIAPGPSSGYQAAAELAWSRDGNTIRAIFRDTTIEAFEGCLDGDLTLGPCGLTGQLLVRISPAGADATACAAPARTAITTGRAGRALRRLCWRRYGC